MRLIFISATLLGCPAGPDPIPNEQPVARPVMELSPATLDFGDQPVGTSTAGRDVQIRNTGDDNLDIYEIFVGEPDDAFSIGTVGQAFRIPPGSARSFVVRFLPEAAGHYATDVLLVSNITPRGQEAQVLVKGVGVAAELDVAEEVVVADLSEPASVPIELRNVGDVTLRLTDFDLSGNAGLGLDLDPDRNGVLPFELEPLNPDTGRPMRTIFVTWDPELADEEPGGVIEISSNDRNREVTPVVVVLGEPE